jgi:hypothetical protein
MLNQAAAWSRRVPWVRGPDLRLWPATLADFECRHNRSAGDATPACGCWPEELTATQMVDDLMAAVTAAVATTKEDDEMQTTAETVTCRIDGCENEAPRRGRYAGRCGDHRGAALPPEPSQNGAGGALDLDALFAGRQTPPATEPETPEPETDPEPEPEPEPEPAARVSAAELADELQAALLGVTQAAKDLAEAEQMVGHARAVLASRWAAVNVLVRETDEAIAAVVE